MEGNQITRLQHQHEKQTERERYEGKRLPPNCKGQRRQRDDANQAVGKGLPERRTISVQASQGRELAANGVADVVALSIL